MAITPADIEQMTFSEDKKHGYNTEEVDAFLDQLSAEVDAMLQKIADLKGRLNNSEQQLAAAQAQVAQLKEQSAATPVEVAPAPAPAADFSASERQISQVLIVAQQSADKLVADARTNAENIRNEVTNGPGIKADHTVIWYVGANRHHDPQKLGSFHLPYLSVYYLKGSTEDEYLHVGGFHEWPVPVARYLVTGNESYGKGPGWFAEGDAKILHLLEKDKLTMVELSVKPPVVADD